MDRIGVVFVYSSARMQVGPREGSDTASVVVEVRRRCVVCMTEFFLVVLGMFGLIRKALDPFGQSSALTATKQFLRFKLQ
jgi:hypothetical protein